MMLELADKDFKMTIISIFKKIKSILNGDHFREF